MIILSIVKPELLHFGLQALVSEIDQNIKQVALEAGEDVLEGIERHAPSVVIVDDSVVGTTIFGSVESMCAENGICLIYLAAGEMQRSPSCSLRIIEEAAPLHEIKEVLLNTITQKRRAMGDSLSDELTPREKDVLKDVALGLSSKEIADKHYISTHTVITHRKNISRKLGVKTISGLTIYAIINKLISVEDLKDKE